MVIIPELKHNKKRDVVIPRACELVAKFGLTKPGKSFSGDDFIDPSASKIDQVKEVNKTAFEE